MNATIYKLFLYVYGDECVFTKHAYKHELLTLRQRRFCGIIESMEEMQFLNDIFTTYIHVVIYTHITC